MTALRLFAGAIKTLGRFRRRDDGVATIEFVLMVPAFMALFMASFESGLLMTRHLIIERALDMTVRDLRLGIMVFPQGADAQAKHDIVKKAICDRTTMIPNCNDVMQLELTLVSQATWGPLPASTTCIDTSANVKPITPFSPGNGNEMMLLRACTVFDPIFPGTGIGLQLPKDGGGKGYLLVSRSAFVNEPT